MYQFIPVTHPCLDTRQPLIMLQSDHGDKYFFGKIGEGSQRACNESKIKFGKLNGIFLTGEMNWQCIGGLPGLVLTASDQGKKNISIFYGSSILDYVVSTWRYFVFRFGLDLKVSALMDEELFRDSNVIVKSIVVENPASTAKDSLEVPGALTTGLKRIVSKMFPEVSPTEFQDPSANYMLNVEIPAEASSNCLSTTSYEVSFPSIRGKFNLDQALRLGVPKGRLFADLTKGKSVTLEDGTVVRPDQVLSETRNFGKVLILDIPYNAYFPKFMEKFRNYSLNDISAVYYLLGDDLKITDDLFRFMELLDGENIQHIVSHCKISPNSIAYESAAIATLKLKALQNDTYNLPITERTYSREFFDCFSKELPDGTSFVQQQEKPVKSIVDKENVHIFERMKGIMLEPYSGSEVKPKVQFAGLVTGKPSSSVEELFKNHVLPLKIEGATQLAIIDEQRHVNNFNHETKNKDVEIMTLGTGSALPSKYRNVISTLLKVPYVERNGSIRNRNIILDAGENTLGSIHRNIPDIDLPQLFQDLKMIYLSHLHADHHLGIASLIMEWFKHNQNTTDMLYVITPWQYKTFVNEWFVMEDSTILSRIVYISCEHLKSGNDIRKQTKPVPLHENGNENKRRCIELDDESAIRDSDTIKKMMNELRIMSFRTCPAIHCDWAYSNSISFFMNASSKRVFKVSYSGDTRPNYNRFAKGIGRNSDLLIHEATLDNELLQEAIKKNHSTINEAIKVCNAMEAEKLILTHFSQRYPKVPKMNGTIKLKAKELCFAFDSMIVSFSDLGKQEEKIDSLGKIFFEEENASKNEDTSTI